MKKPFLKKIGWLVELDGKTYSGYIMVENNIMTREKIADLSEMLTNQLRVSLQKLILGRTELDDAQEENY